MSKDKLKELNDDRNIIKADLDAVEAELEKIRINRNNAGIDLEEAQGLFDELNSKYDKKYAEVIEITNDLKTLEEKINEEKRMDPLDKY